MKGKPREQLLLEYIKATEYSKGLAMGLWVLKRCQSQTPQGIKFMIKALEDEAKRNELNCTLMLKEIKKIEELVVCKKAA